MFLFITYSRELKLIILQETAGKNRVYGATPGKILIFHEFTRIKLHFLGVMLESVTELYDFTYIKGRKGM